MAAALQAGYRHIDTAEMYGNEEEVGSAIAESGVPRAETFVTTKVWHEHLGPGEVRRAAEGSLGRLGLDHVDLLLIHWPSPDGRVRVEDYATELAEVADAGLARQIGLSNHPIALVDRAAAAVGQGWLATNQVEVHPYLQNGRLAKHCKAMGMPLTAYLPLAKGRVAGDPVLARIGAAHGTTAALATLAFLLAEGHIVIPSSSKPARIAENFAARDIVLTEGEIAEIRGLDRGERFTDVGFAPDWD